MTVASETNRSGPYTGNGATTVFNYEFRILNEAHIQVLRVFSGEVTVLTLGTDYTVTGVGDAGGGSITTATAPTAAQTITILRDIPFTQETDLENQGPYFAETVEGSFDLSVMRDQQIFEVVSRGIAVPASDPTVPAPLPSIAERAGKMAAFDADGNLTAGSVLEAGFVSAAMQAVVGASTLALGREALGVGIGAGLQSDGAGNMRVIELTVEVAANQAINAASYFKRFIATGALTFTQARATTLFPGFKYTIHALTRNVTVAIDPNDTFYGFAGGASITVPKGKVATITTNGTATWWLDMAPVGVFNIQDYGADATGVTDCAAALNAVIAAVVVAGSGVVRCPSGNYKVGSSIAFSFASTAIAISFEGEGPYATRFLFDYASGWWFDIGNGVGRTNNISFSNMEFAANVTQTSGGAFRARNAGFLRWTNCIWTGPKQMMLLGSGVATNDVVYVFLTDGLVTPGANANAPMIELKGGSTFNMAGSWKFNGANHAGNYLFGHTDANYNWDGLFISGALICEQWDRFISVDTNSNGMANVIVNGAIMTDRATDSFVLISPGVGGLCKDWNINGVIFGGDPSLAGVVGVNLSAALGGIQGVAITNCRFMDTTSYGVLVGANVSRTVVNGCSFVQCGQGGFPVIRGTAASTVLVMGNMIGARTTPGYTYGISWDGAAHATRLGSTTNNSITAGSSGTVAGTP